MKLVTVYSITPLVNNLTRELVHAVKYNTHLSETKSKDFTKTMQTNRTVFMSLNDIYLVY